MKSTNKENSYVKGTNRKNANGTKGRKVLRVQIKQKCEGYKQNKNMNKYKEKKNVKCKKRRKYAGCKESKNI